MGTQAGTQAGTRLGTRVSPRARDKAQLAEQLLHAGAEVSGGTLGQIVTWTVEPVLVDRVELRAVMDTLGLLSFLPPSIKPKTAMKRALDTIVAQTKARKDGVVVKRVTDNEEYALYVLKREFASTSAIMPGLPDIDWSTELQMVWYKTLGDDPERALAFSDEERGGRIRPWVRNYLDGHTAGDISLALVGMVRSLDGISMRGGGGVYFVPQSSSSDFYVPRARRLLAWLEKGFQATGSFLSAFEVPRREQTEADLARHFAADMRADLKRLADDIKEKEQTARRAATSQSSRATGVSVETVGKYMLQADELAEKARFYADLLHLDAGAIEQEVTRLAERLERLKQVEVPF